ncbi:DUF4826 family protein [Rheinheimera sp.]|uniref:DUF4826 family protein n=1 Tax=Rheinheimera sp. TaxID=1869214 RepID=UPI002631CBEA|nr:DUF4826 family protein [Rheinheimera sp.]MCA1929773.1 DUF4826 family protein [Rheinheimera sp.]
MADQLTPEQQEQSSSEWVRAQFQKANQYLAEKGILPDNVAVSESRYLTPLMAIWKITAQDRKQYWVISGDLPTDHMALSAAKDAREAVRAFSLHWQLKAEQIMNSGAIDKTKVEFANLLINRAHGLYDLFDKEELWNSSN